jgi:hypothetical protein
MTGVVVGSALDLSGAHRQHRASGPAPGFGTSHRCRPPLHPRAGSSTAQR